MCILQIGELANGLSNDFRTETKGEMPWGMIRGMRNWIAHAYAEIDESIIWETATNDIPGHFSFCNRIIEKYYETEVISKSSRSNKTKSKNDWER